MKLAGHLIIVGLKSRGNLHISQDKLNLSEKKTMLSYVFKNCQGDSLWTTQKW